MINFVVKKPLTKLDGTAFLRFGQYGLASGDVDVSVPLAKNLYSRVGIFLERRGSFRNNAEFENQNFIGDLLWQPTNRTRASFEYEFIRQNQPGQRLRRFNDKGFSGGVLSAEDSALTGRVGAVVKPRDNFSIYGSFSNSYARPGILSQTPSANGPHPPERGRQFETGAKTELLNKKLLITASIFQINKTDVLRPDPRFGPNGNNFNALLTVGAIRNRGFEFDVNGAITPRWNVSFNYAYINSKITKDINPALIGKTLANVSPNTAGFFTRYDLTRTIGVGFSGEFVDDRIEPFAGLKAPAYKTFDLSYYQTFLKRFRLNLKIENIADRVFSTSSLFAFRAGNFPGQPRTFSASLTVLSFKKNLD